MPTGAYGPSDTESFDLGPWVDTPSSSRVSRYRYDYANRALQVQWVNQKNQGYVYEDMDRQGYQNFARAVSKGKFINRVLNGYPYRLMTDEEVIAESNPNRRALSSRVRG